MATGKRASMREGPLAALFRKTEEDAAQADARAAPSAGRRPRRAAAPEPPPIDEIPAARRSRTRRSRARDEPPPRARARASRRRRSACATRSRSDIPDNIMERRARAERRARRRASHERDAVRAPPSATRPVRPGRAGRPARAARRRRRRRRRQRRQPHGRGRGRRASSSSPINTDLQSLQQSIADITLHIGAALTRGLGSGSNPELGRAAAMEEYDRIKALLKGSDMVFITAGAGGGTGTGAAPVVARIARELGALTVGIVTKPFGFEGTRRARAGRGRHRRRSRDEVDTLIVVPNNRLLSVLDKQTSMVEAFRVADDVLRQGVQGISDLVTLPGLINLDFADVRTIMSEAGNALLGIGMGTGENRAIDGRRAGRRVAAARDEHGGRALDPAVDHRRHATCRCGRSTRRPRPSSEAAHPDANIIFGAMVDEKLEDQVWVTVVATGYDGDQRRARGARRRRASRSPRASRASRAAPRAADDARPRARRDRARRAASSPAPLTSSTCRRHASRRSRPRQRRVDVASAAVRRARRGHRRRRPSAVTAEAGGARPARRAATPSTPRSPRC